MMMRGLKVLAAVGSIAIATSALADNRQVRPDNSRTDTKGRIEQPDNSGINERDRNDATLTPFDQSTKESDQEVTRKIRVAINDESQLSMNAHNVKIITDDSGQVVLRGPVDSDKERSDVERLARKVANNRTIVNRLEVTGKNK